MSLPPVFFSWESSILFFNIFFLSLLWLCLSVCLSLFLFLQAFLSYTQVCPYYLFFVLFLFLSIWLFPFKIHPLGLDLHHCLSSPYLLLSIGPSLGCPVNLMGKLLKIPVLVPHPIPIWDPAKADNLYFIFSPPIKISVCSNLTLFCYLCAETELPKVTKDSFIPKFCLHCSNIKLFNIYGACNSECTFSPLDFHGCSLLAHFFSYSSLFSSSLLPFHISLSLPFWAFKKFIGVPMGQPLPFWFYWIQSSVVILSTLISFFLCLLHSFSINVPEILPSLAKLAKLQKLEGIIDISPSLIPLSNWLITYVDSVSLLLESLC